MAAACAAARAADPAAAMSSIASSAARAYGSSLGGRLHLDEATVAGHHHVHVDGRGRIFLVVEVEQRLAVHDADADRRDGVEERQLVEAQRLLELLRHLVHGHVGAADARRARAAVGLEHVAVDGDGALADDAEVHDGAQTAADEALDLHGATALLAAHRLALRARGRGPRQHAVLGGQPAATRAAQPAGHAFAQRGRAQHVRVAQLDARGSGGELRHVGDDAHRPHLGGFASCSQDGPPSPPCGGRAALRRRSV